MKIKKWKGILVFAMVGLLCLVALIPGENRAVKEISYIDFWSLAEKGEILSVGMGNEENWEVTLKDGTAATTPNPRSEGVKEKLLQMDIQVTEKQGSDESGIMLAVSALFLGAMMIGLRKNNAMGLQKYAAVQANENIPKITFEDVAVSGETLHSMKDLVDFLQAPERFLKYGARVPKGVLLYGPPGTGKTLLAKALAGEAKAPFFAMSGADFVQVYVGVGASRVRELFKKARKAGGGVIFIDEIDAIGKKRDSGNDEREQTLNALLTEMSGFSGSDGIIVLAATNRLDTLDAALLREGRFDRRIEISLPDCEAREKILKVHARNKPLGQGISITDWAKRTTLFSGAQLESMLNEAAIRAARRNTNVIDAEDMEEAYLSVTVGESRPTVISETEKRITAYHEAGHALITHQMLPEAKLVRLTIIPSSRGAAGYAMSVQPDKLLHTRQELMAMMCAAYGGRAAEEIIFGSDFITTGASGDLKKIRNIAKAMEEEFEMGESAKQLEKEALEKAMHCLKENRDTLDRLAVALMEQETLQTDEIYALL
ncbi:MAG: ATP-dependent zinc metalloprotease FtsH [Clostridiales bacterium]|nr:ATP-dependent zinc metalloprotease FtsH [Clostridiales bacterium]